MESGHKPYAQLPDCPDMELVPLGAAVQMPPGATVQMPPGAAVQMPPGAAAVQMPPGDPPPHDYLAWSLSSLLYFNCCCLGLMAVIFSIKSRDRRMLGDHSGALSYGSTAKGLNIAAVVLVLVLVVIITAVVASVLTTRY